MKPTAAVWFQNKMFSKGNFAACLSRSGSKLSALVWCSAASPSGKALCNLLNAVPEERERTDGDGGVSSPALLWLFFFFDFCVSLHADQTQANQAYETLTLAV